MDSVEYDYLAKLDFDLAFPEHAAFLFESHDYKVLYGGRGSTKSWDFATAMLVLCSKKKLFCVCGREIQDSIKESVHKLLSDRIASSPKLRKIYRVLDNEIRCTKTGSRIAFQGMKQNIEAVKSTEAIDIYWASEARNVSKNSWQVLLPTVRLDAPHGPFGKGSEVWVDFNPELDTDPTYELWVLNPPEGTVAVEINYQNNPWFPDRLRKLMERDRRADADDARTVWDGKTRKTLKGAIYAKEIEQAIKDKRISPKIVVDRTKPCVFVFDLGKRDMCCWWAIQQIGMQHNVVDFYGNTGQDIDHFLDEIERRKYKVGKIVLPHDARHGQQAAAKLGARLNTIEKQVKAVYPGRVKTLPVVGVSIGINATRALFPRFCFNEENTREGVNWLARYQYEIKNGKRSVNPLHDEASNPADALRQYAVWLKEGLLVNTQEEDEEDTGRTPLLSGTISQAWMG